jgi:TonB-linked SusC/RagA family outer membrane protein
MKNKLLKKVIMVSKYAIIGTFLQVFLFGMLLASESKAQKESLSEIYLSLDLRDQKIGDALQIISEKTGFNFVYNRTTLNLDKKITITTRKKELYSILMDISKVANVQFKRVNNSIYVKEKEGLEQNIIEVLDELGQTLTITGRVTSEEDGQGLPGVNVIEMGTASGTTTNLDGRYSINVPSENTVLIFSSVGMVTEEVAVNGRSIINLRMVADIKTLGEIVVTAFGIEREAKALGYSVQGIKGDDITEAREVNIANSLQGRVAGVHINRSAGGSAGIVIRGNSSLQGNNSPLIVVDGVPIDNQQLGAGSLGGARDYGDGISSINPDDVESISVLKGPAASALYGARGANGVILVTTKKGRARSGIGVSVNSNTVFENINVFPVYQNKYSGGYDDGYGELGVIVIDGVEYSQYRDHFDQWGGEMDGRLIQIRNMPHVGLVPFSPQPRDNIRHFFETGKTFTNSISMEGGGDRTSFIASVGNMSQTGVVPNNQRDRNMFNVKINSQVSNGLYVESRANYTREKWENVPIQGNLHLNPMSSLTLIPRFISLEMLQPHKTPEGKQNQWRAAAPYNPYWSVNELLNEQTRDRMMGYVLARYNFTDWLSLQGRAGTDFYTQKRFERQGAGVPGVNINGTMEQQQWDFREENLDALLIASNKLSNDFNGSLTLGAQHLNRSQERVGIAGSNLSIPDYFHINNAGTVTPGYNLTRRQMNSVFMLGQLAYKNMLFIDVTGRNDWSSTLGSNNRSFFYPSVSTSFAFTDAFAIESNILTFGKIRASYAQAGNDAFPYMTKSGYSTGTQSFGAFSYLSIPGRVPLTNLKNELSTAVEFGADLRLFNNRFGIDFTYYEQNTKNQIIPITISATSGFTSMVINAGNIENKGMELMLTADIIQSGGFRWNMSLNGSRNKSKLTELAEGVETHTLNSSGLFGGFVIAKVGEAFGNINGYKYRTVDDPDSEFHGQRLLTSSGQWQRTATREILGNIQPDFVGGISNAIFFKGIELGGLIDFSIGGQMLSGTKGEGYSRGMHIDTENRIGLIAEGVIAKDGSYVPSDIVLLGQQYYAGKAWSTITEEFVLNADFATLREVTLGYRFTPDILSRTPFTSAKLSIVGRNLVYLYRDPEVKKMGIAPEGQFNTSSAATGYEIRGIPPTRNVGFNLSFSF